MVRWICCALLAMNTLGADSDYYRVIDILSSRTQKHSRDPDWKPSKGLVLEVTGIATLDDERIAVAIRKGEVWVVHHAYSEDPSAITFTRFASGLDEPLGLLRDGDDLLTAQRSEVTRLRDRNSDGEADEYLSEMRGWHVSGAYHGYAYGPVRDKHGHLWTTLNLDMGDHSDNAQPWRGWAMRLSSTGELQAVAAGLRSPCGLGVNLEGDVFATDQQGNWIPTNNLIHLREGAYFGNPDGMAPASLPSSLVRPLQEGVEVAGKSYPEALKLLPQLRSPAVWFPYVKMGQSRTNFVADSSKGRFGPYGGQLFVGEFTQSKIGRVFLEKVNGEYQGACFPFIEGFPAAVLSLAFGTDGSLLAGMTNRGWSSVGGGSYGLQRVQWTGKTPFELLEMRAQPNGFQLVFTKPVDPASAGNPASYRMISYTYPLHATYGGEEILKESLTIKEAILGKDGRSVRLVVKGLRPYFVHELDYSGVRSAEKAEPWHDRAYYTLNQIPAGSSP